METWTGLAGQMGIMSIAIQEYSVPIIVFFFAFAILLGWSLPRWTGLMRAKLDHKVPPYSFYSLFVGSGFLLCLSALVRVGVPIPEALRRLRQSAKPWYLEKIDAVLFHVNEGQQLGDALYLSGYGFPDPEIIEDLKLYASLGNFDERMENMAREWIDEGVERVRIQAQGLNLGMMLTMGLLVGWMGLGLMALLEQVTSAF
jgi:type II secretory pathway component PulF